MDTTSLDDLAALNEELAALADAGVPLDIALGDPRQPVAKSLERIRSTVARRVRRGETLEEALEGDADEVPASYRSLLEMQLHAGELSTVLDGSHRAAEAVDNTRDSLEFALIYPLILCLLAYLGLIGFCLYLVPVWQGMYESLHLEPGPAVRTVMAVRDAMPYWSVLIPLVLAVTIFIWQRTRRHCSVSSAIAAEAPIRLPGARQTLYFEHCAQFAAALNALLAAGTPLDEALRIAGDAANDSNLRAGANLLANDMRCGALPDDSGRAARLFPPFLRWTLWHAEESTGRGPALDIAARLYRQLAERRADRLRVLAPIAAILLLGGTVTLLYGLALFAPFVELLRTLAS